MIDGIIIGFFIGSIAMGLCLNWFIKILKKNGYIEFDATDKLKSELKK